MVLLRKDFTDVSTVGELHINGSFFCYTLEDTSRRDVNGDGHLAKWEKVQGRTAIPSGRYEVVINYSERFNRLMPLLLDVPFFQGVRIHNGNTEKDTHGCILVGMTKGKDWIGASREAFAKVYFRIVEMAAAEKVFIHVQGGLEARHFAPQRLVA